MEEEKKETFDGHSFKKSVLEYILGCLTLTEQAQAFEKQSTFWFTSSKRIYISDSNSFSSGSNATYITCILVIFTQLLSRTLKSFILKILLTHLLFQECINKQHS